MPGASAISVKRSGGVLGVGGLLLVRKSARDLNSKSPPGWEGVDWLSMIRSTFPPNFRLWLPLVKNTLSYTCHEFQLYSAGCCVLSPPEKKVSPGTPINPTVFPG